MAWRRKSFTDGFGVNWSFARAACRDDQSTERSTANWGMVALLRVMERASARRMGEREEPSIAGRPGARRVEADSIARRISLSWTRPRGPVPEMALRSMLF